jgi:hypothetical protein
MKDTEDHFRHLFAADRKNPELDDDHLMLIDVFDQPQLFYYHPGEPEEVCNICSTIVLTNQNEIPRVFPLEKRETSGPAIVSQETFLKQFGMFTENQLKELNWDNVFVAGGSVLASVTPAKKGSAPYQIREYYQSDIFAASDIDLFIYGISPEAATAKVCKIVRCF